MPRVAGQIFYLIFIRLQEIFGGNAVSDEYGIGRHVANLFVTQTYEVRRITLIDVFHIDFSRDKATYIASYWVKLSLESKHLYSYGIIYHYPC